MTGVSLSSEKVREAKRKDHLIRYFLGLKKRGSKPKWDEVMKKGNELEVGTNGLLFRKMTGPESLRRMQVVIFRKMADAVLETVLET